MMKLKLKKEKTMKLTIILNGTNENPFHKMGLKQNPFPQLGMQEYDAMCLHLQKLGADPIPDTSYIKNHLKGWSKEFVELCCEKFKKGEMIEFEVTFEE